MDQKNINLRLMQFPFVLALIWIALSFYFRESWHSYITFALGLCTIPFLFLFVYPPLLEDRTKRKRKKIKIIAVFVILVCWASMFLIQYTRFYPVQLY